MKMKMNKVLETPVAITPDDLHWIKKYLRNASPSGNEVAGQKLWLDYVKDYCDTHWVDAYGNVVAILNPEEKFKVVIEAHADEIAWYIHRITKNGFLHVEKNGGADPGIAPSQKVRIHTETGEVPGVFGWPAVHTRKTDPKTPSAENIFIDCGCASDDDVAKLGIKVGDCVTYDSVFTVMNKDFFVGRGQDNKMGGYIIASVLRMLRQNEIKLPFGLYVVNSVQEEVGLHGAGMVAHAIKPNCVIATDVTHSTDTPLIDKDKQGEISLGEGPVVTKAPPVHNKLRQLIVDTAREEHVKFQLAVSSKKTGTDADAFAYTNAGIPSALISLPLRYMHTTMETTHRADVENSIRLLSAVLSKLKPDMDFNYFR
jgi:putative aminopeptidase FrvX